MVCIEKNIYFEIRIEPIIVSTKTNIFLSTDWYTWLGLYCMRLWYWQLQWSHHDSNVDPGYSCCYLFIVFELINPFKLHQIILSYMYWKVNLDKEMDHIDHLRKKEGQNVCWDAPFFESIFFYFNQLPAPKKMIKKRYISTNVWPFLFW